MDAGQVRKQDVEEFNRTIFQDHRRGLHDRHPASPNVRQSQFRVSVDSRGDQDDAYIGQRKSVLR